MATIQKLLVELGANSQSLVKELTQGRNNLQKFAQDAARIGTRVSMALATSATAIGAGVLAATNQLVNTGREIENLSRLANTGTRDFQALAIGARQYGFEQDKVADILKDMNDRVGDFIQTGGGPMADFFEKIAPKVGVTAEQFKNLSGKDALQLYVSSLEKANLSQADMTFYMEAIASDSTTLLPLLQNNGEALRTIGDEAERTGVLLSEIDLKRLQELEKSLRQIREQIEGAKNQVLLEAVPAFQEFADELNKPETVQNMQALAKAAAEIAKWVLQAAGGMADFGGKLGQELGVIAQGIAGLDLEEQRGRILNALENPSERLRFFGPGGIVEYFSESELKAELERINSLIEMQAKAKKTRAALPQSDDVKQKQDVVSDAIAAGAPKSEEVIAWGNKIESLQQMILDSPGKNITPILNEINALKEKIANSTDPMVGSNDKNTTATEENTRALNAAALAQKGASGGAWEKIFGKPKEGKQGDKVDQNFARAAQEYKRAIENGATGTAEAAANRMKEILESFQKNPFGHSAATADINGKWGTSTGRADQYDVAGMQRVLDALLNGQSEKDLGTLTLNMQSDNSTQTARLNGESIELRNLVNYFQRAAHATPGA